MCYATELSPSVEDVLPVSLRYEKMTRRPQCCQRPQPAMAFAVRSWWWRGREWIATSSNHGVLPPSKEKQWIRSWRKCPRKGTGMMPPSADISSTAANQRLGSQRVFPRTHCPSVLHMSQWECETPLKDNCSHWFTHSSKQQSSNKQFAGSIALKPV